MNKTQKKLLARLMAVTNSLGGTLDGTATCEQKYIDRQRAHRLSYKVIYGLFGDNPNNPYREDDINNAYKAIEEMEKLVQKVYPDRSGFLTRGCPNKCKWCVVPTKEGKITPYMDIEEIAIDGRKNIILMDNNVLASDYGLQQIEKIVSMGVRVDFNQGLDARLVTDDIAQLLARVKWMNCIRFGCDTPGQIAECERATALIDKYGYKGEYFFYCILMNDFKEAFNRVNHWRKRGRRFLPHAQPYRDLNNPHQIIPQWQKDLAGWVDKKWIFRSCEFKDFIPRKGFKCSEYFFNQL